MENTIQSDLIRGHINTIILKALYDGDRYGYDIVREIEQKSSGQYKLKQPTLYSCLKRLEIQGFIRSYWGAKTSGGRRKYFTLTDMGRELFLKNQSEWEYSRTVIDKLISDREVDLSSARPLGENEGANAFVSEAQAPQAEQEVQEEQEAEKEPAAQEVCDERETSDDEAQAEKPPVAFSDTTAIMNELFRMQTDSEKDASYAEKLISEKYVSDRTDAGFSSDTYFRDFFDASEEEEEKETEPEPAPAPAPAQTETFAPPLFHEIEADTYSPFTPEQRQEEPEQQEPAAQKNEFLDYHTTSVAADPDSTVIEREYRNILGDILSDSFVDRSKTEQAQTEQAPADEEYEEEPQTEQDYYEQDYGNTQDYDDDPYAGAIQDDELSEEDYTRETYTSDADVNRKLNKITGQVRGMGDNVTIRTHNNQSAKEYNNAYYYYCNKLMLVHYAILFGVMMLEILFTAVFVGPVLHAGRSTDKWFFILAAVVAVAFPVVAFIKNFLNTDQRKRINFHLRNSLIFRFIVMAQCFLIIYCLNIIAGMPLSFGAEYVTTVLLPALLCTNFPVSAGIFNALYKSGKFNVEQ